MDESEKRRERLKAMRMEAAQVGVNNDVENSTQTQGLSIPLLGTSSTNQDPGPQRFGYYTDPLAAFSGNKRSKVSQNVSREHFTPTQQKTVMTPPPSLPSQIMHQQVRPTGIPGTPHGDWNESAHHTHGYNIPPNSQMGGNFLNTASPGYGQGSSPIIYSQQGRGQWVGNSCPSPNSGHGGVPHSGYEGGPSLNPEESRGHWSYNGQSPGSVRGGRDSYDSGQGRGYWSGNIPSPGRGRGSSPGVGQGNRPNFNQAQGRGSWPRNSHNPSSGYAPNLGRGSGQWSGNNLSPGSGRSSGRGRGRGRGSYDNISAELRPDLYYNKSMVEDPWKFLKPIIWTREEYPPAKTSKSWLPKSIRASGTKASVASTDSKSQPSLAEYLAASFNDAIKHEDTHES